MRCRRVSRSLDALSTSSPIGRGGPLGDHLAACADCRAELRSIESVKAALRAMDRPAMPRTLVRDIRDAVAAELAVDRSPRFCILDDRRRWADRWLIPSAVGGAASVLFGLILLSIMLLPPGSLPAGDGVSGPAVLLASNSSDALDLNESEFLSSRAAFAAESPSVNPRGALIAFTRSILQSDIKDDEVVVVADVFGDGLAEVVEVVEPSNDPRTAERIERAFSAKGSMPPFVPASADHRGDLVRVVFRIQSVNVSH